MSNRTNSPDCERSSDLMAFVYNEMAASELREFESHLQECGVCRADAASFGPVRESIVAWRDEVLAGFISSPRVETKRSAVAAFKQFFDLSPLWLKAAGAFAVLTFCVLAALLYVNLRKEETIAVRNEAVYTQQDVDRMVADALAKQQEEALIEQAPSTVATLSPEPTPSKRSAIKPTPGNRSPLSQAEREQLAADLRLLPTDDDLDFPDDRINQ